MAIEGREGTGQVSHPILHPGYTYDGEPDAPQAPAEPSLADLKVAELRELAEARGIDHEGLKKAELVAALE